MLVRTLSVTLWAFCLCILSALELSRRDSSFSRSITSIPFTLPSWLLICASSSLTDYSWSSFSFSSWQWTLNTIIPREKKCLHFWCTFWLHVQLTLKSMNHISPNTKDKPRCFAKSRTAQCVFQPILSISCAGVTGRQGLLSHAQNAVKLVAGLIHMVGRSSLNVATLWRCSCPSCTPSHRTISFLSTWLCVRYLHIVEYGYCSQHCTWCMVFFKAAISCCMEERCSSCSLAVASLFSKWVCFSWNVASSASSEAIYKLYDIFCISEVK